MIPRWLRQSLWLASANLRALLLRPGLSLVVMMSVGLTVLVFDSTLSVGFGMMRMFADGTHADRALFLQSGATEERSSFLYNRNMGALRHKDIAASSPEVVVTGMHLPSRRTGGSNRLILRGVSDAAFDIRSEVRIVSGRMFETGRMEMIVGVRAASELEGLDIGDDVPASRGGAHYVVVGHFAAGGGPHESEAWAHLPMVQSTHSSSAAVNSLWIRALQADRLDAIRTAVEAHPRVDADLLSEREYFQNKIAEMIPHLWTLALVLGGLMALASTAATLCVSLWTVRSRGAQLATLRAMGFGSGILALSLTLETLVLVVLGCIVGSVAAYWIFDGASTSMRGSGVNADLLAFDLAVTPTVAAIGLAAAVAIGLVGALMPAVQARRMSIALALQQR